MISFRKYIVNVETLYYATFEPYTVSKLINESYVINLLGDLM